MVLVTAMMVAAMLQSGSGGSSYYPVRLEDPKAVYLTADKFPVHGDGVADDSDALQEAIDKVQETTGQGILFIPEGRYRLSKTITVWPGIRLIGYGASRPVFLLGPNAPGYQQIEKYMVFFAGRRPDGQAVQPAVPESAGRSGAEFGLPNDANPGTFYSALSNVDFEIGNGNPAAVAIRGTYAQHCYLAHIDFRLHSGLAAIHDTGNEAHDLRFFGGEYGIITRTPSPGWQFTLIDSSFEGQTQAAIRTRAAGLTLIRPSFKNVPTAISLEPDRTEQLWLKDGRFEQISGPAVVISRENSLRTQINMEGVACNAVPVFAQFRQSGKIVAAPGETYEVISFSHGLRYSSLGATPSVDTRFEAHKLAEMPAPPKSDVPALPPADSWVNLRSLGAKGDGVADDTEALRNAISQHQAIYLPSGHYRVRDTIALRPDTALIGLNPITTQIVLPDGTPGFFMPDASPGGRRGGLPFPGNPKPLLETPKGGTNIVTGIGLDTGGNNPAAVGALWKAGPDSMMDDVKFIGGHGSNVPIYNENHSADANAERHWDSEYPSLWVTDGGGGTFKNIWTASTYAQAGMMVSNTRTEGRVYQLSSEHHVRHEVQIRNASNWQFVALQTEEERGEGPFALPLEIQDCSNITVANLNMYRVVSVFQPFPQAVKVSGSKNIRFRNVHCYSNSKASFDSLLYDSDHNFQLRQREFAWLTVSGEKPRPSQYHVDKLASGFFNISGGAVDPHGDFYFVDNHWNRIYRWDGRLSTVQDAPLSPVNLVFDDSGNLMVISYAGKGTVYSFKPSDEEVHMLTAEPATNRPGKTAVFAVTGWETNPNLAEGKPLQRAYQFVSPDGSTFIPASRGFINGALSWGVKLDELIRSFGLAKAVPGRPFYVTSESDMRTYSVNVQPDGTMDGAKLFAEQGGEGVAVGPDGNVYIVAGQIYVYSPSGKMIDTIEVPERPIQIAFGGKDGKTLFIAARTSLYSLRVK